MPGAAPGPHARLPPTQEETTMTGGQPGQGPTVALVHGAFADSAGWNDVVSALLTDGVPVRAISNPLRGIDHDAEYVGSALGQIPGPVLAVGHSYGGAVITNAALRAGNVVGLVYVAAFAPDEGEALIEIEADSKDSVLNSALQQWSYPGAGGETETEFAIDPEQFHDAFAADVPEHPARAAARAAPPPPRRRPPRPPGAGDGRPPAPDLHPWVHRADRHAGVAEPAVVGGRPDRGPGGGQRRRAAHGRAGGRDHHRGRGVARHHDLAAEGGDRGRPAGAEPALHVAGAPGAGGWQSPPVTAAGQLRTVARTLVLVEGVSDREAVLAAARGRGRDLAAEGARGGAGGGAAGRPRRRGGRRGRGGGASGGGAVLAAARGRGRDLAAEGVRVVAMGGAGGVRRNLALAGPGDRGAGRDALAGRGVARAAGGVRVVAVGGAGGVRRNLALAGPGVRVRGLYDVAEEGFVRRALGPAAGADLAASGFFACVADLEEELIRAAGTAGAGAGGGGAG